MKAIVYNGPRDVAVKDVPDAKIEKPTDVLVRITTTNIDNHDQQQHEVEGRQIGQRAPPGYAKQQHEGDVHSGCAEDRVHDALLGVKECGEVNGAFRASPDAALQRPHVLTAKGQVQGGDPIVLGTQLEQHGLAMRHRPLRLRL